MSYSRKNLQNPSAQHWPHTAFEDEIDYLSSQKQLQRRLQGTAHILGPITKDHWFVYAAEISENPTNDAKVCTYNCDIQYPQQCWQDCYISKRLSTNMNNLLIANSL